MQGGEKRKEIGENTDEQDGGYVVMVVVVVMSEGGKNSESRAGRRGTRAEKDLHE